MAREVKQWITVDGQHIPIFEGQSKDSVVKSYIAKNKKAAASKSKSTSNAEKKPEEPKYKTQISEKEFQETVKKHFAKPESQNSAVRESEDRKAKQIAKNKEQADIASGKKSSSETRDEKFVNDLVNDITKDVNANSDPEDLISNGDVQSIVEAYAIMHKDVNEDKILKAVRDGVELKIGGKTQSTKLSNKEDIIDALATKYKLPANSNVIPVQKIRTDLQEILKQSGKDWSDDDYYFMLGSIVMHV